MAARVKKARLSTGLAQCLALGMLGQSKKGRGTGGSVGAVEDNEFLFWLDKVLAGAACKP